MSINTFNNLDQNIQLKFNNTSPYMTILVLIITTKITLQITSSHKIYVRGFS